MNNVTQRDIDEADSALEFDKATAKTRSEILEAYWVEYMQHLVNKSRPVDVLTANGKEKKLVIDPPNETEFWGWYITTKMEQDNEQS